MNSVLQNIFKEKFFIDSSYNSNKLLESNILEILTLSKPFNFKLSALLEITEIQICRDHKTKRY